MTVEICGVLVGNWGSDENGPYAAVTDYIRCENAASKFAEVTFTHESWAQINKEMDLEVCRQADRRLVSFASGLRHFPVRARLLHPGAFFLGAGAGGVCHRSGARSGRRVRLAQRQADAAVALLDRQQDSHRRSSAARNVGGGMAADRCRPNRVTSSQARCNGRENCAVGSFATIALGMLAMLLTWVICTAAGGATGSEE